MNINDNVVFKLTEYGKSILIERKKKDNELIEHVIGTEHIKNLIEPDNNGFYNMQLWKVLNIFGSKCFMGANQIFVNNEIKKGQHDEQ